MWTWCGSRHSSSFQFEEAQRATVTCTHPVTTCVHLWFRKSWLKKKKNLLHSEPWIGTWKSMWNNSYSFSEYSVKKVSTRQNGIVYNRLHCLPFQYISELKFTLSKNFPNISSIHFKSNQIKRFSSKQSCSALCPSVTKLDKVPKCYYSKQKCFTKKTTQMKKNIFISELNAKVMDFFFF